MDPNRSLNIPEEIVLEILTMLPVKSLCRFRCVSKHWFSIISDPNFVDEHLSRSKLRPKLLISYTRGKRGLESSSDKITFYSIEYPKEHHESSIMHATYHDSIFNYLYSGVLSASSASGLICCNCYRGINIGNPITGKFNLIQYPEGSYRWNPICFLGFDPIDRRQVMLKLVLCESDHVKSSVFTLGHWHDITPPQQFICYIEKPSICVNGVIYFLAWDYYHNSNTQRLYAFDVRSECFEVIQCNFTDDFKLILIEYRGCVALVGSKYYVKKLWILKDPKKHRWSSKSFVCPDNFWDHKYQLFGATHRGELIFATEFLREGAFDLFLYEIDTNTLRRFKVYGLDCPNSIFGKITSLDFLIESLYSPK